jgi:hypothetical protein
MVHATNPKYDKDVSIHGPVEAEQSLLVQAVLHYLIKGDAESLRLLREFVARM